MKYGEHLKANMSPDYGAVAYLNYSELVEISPAFKNIAVFGISHFDGQTCEEVSILGSVRPDQGSHAKIEECPFAEQLFKIRYEKDV